MQGVAPGVIDQLGHGPARQLTHAELPGHGRQLLCAQASQPHPGDPVIPPGEAAPSLAQPAQLTRTGRYQRQHPVGLHPPQGKKQRLGRKPVTPVQVIDHQHDNLVTGLEVAERRHHVRTDGHRVGGFPRPAGRGSLRGRRPGSSQELLGEPPG